MQSSRGQWPNAWQKSNFVHLHVHTEFSMLDGLGPVATSASRPDRIGYVNRAAQLGMPALAITDHGNLCGAPEFYHACMKQGIEPIIGEEFYFVEDSTHRPKKGEKAQERHHVVILARGARGYEVLSELSTESHRRFYSKPLIDHNVLEELSEKDRDSLYVLSGCANSIISNHIRADEMDLARHQLERWSANFKHFVIELQHHDTHFDRQLNVGLLALAKEYKLDWVVTNDPHYVVPEDDCHHDALLAIQTASNIDDPNRFRFDGKGYHLRAQAEMRRVFKQHYGAHVWAKGQASTLRIAESCRTRIPGWDTRTWQIPEYRKGKAKKLGSHEFLRVLVQRRLRKLGLTDDPRYVDRANEELDIIEQVGIADFLLITRDIIVEAMRLGVRVGPGRGSVCGSLVGYLIDIHKVDPVKYDLLFERFLNPARPKMPDIDTDLAQSGREKLYDYVRSAYGEENTVHVAAYGHMQLKAAFQQLARAHGIGFQESLAISKTLEALDDLPESLKENYPDLAKQLERLTGVKRSISNHPAGIVIAAPEANLRKQVPLMYIPSSKRFVGMFDLDAIEELGLMKQDLLGLKTLDMITKCVEFIEQRHGITLDPDKWVPDDEPKDKKVYRMLAKGRTAGVFQMEGGTNTRGVKDVKPVCFEDIVSTTSLYRTGAIEAGFPPVFLANRRSGEIDYVHPALEPILGATMGVVLYQEQVMEMGKTLAGFSMIEVDDIKEAIKHKKGLMMQSMKPKFIKGCMEVTGMNRKQAKECWRYIEGYAGYGYNRSHAVAYSLITYQTARLKALYPHEFWAAQLSTVDQSTDDGKAKRDRYLREAVDDGFKILPPDINLSGWSAQPEGDNGIRFGFTDIAGIGDKAAERLLAAREEIGEYDDPATVLKAANKRTYEALEACGALASLGVEFDPTQQEKLLKWQFNDPMRKWRKQLDHLVDFPDDQTLDKEVVTIVGMITEITKRTTKKGADYLEWNLRWSTSESYTVKLWSGTQIRWQLPIGSVVGVKGQWDVQWNNLAVADPRKVSVYFEPA